MYQDNMSVMLLQNNVRGSSVNMTKHTRVQFFLLESDSIRGYVCEVLLY